MPTAVQRLIAKRRQELLDLFPYCQHCGAEHTPTNKLQYHHVVPQHTKYTDHNVGYLLCQGCHAAVSTVDRNSHKVVDQDGYTVQDHNPYHWKKNIRAKKRAEIKALIDQFA